jgi:hypothetical protein
MAEPITIATAVITGLVGAYKAYAEYKAAVAKATEQKAPPPAKSPEAAKGEQAAPIIKVGVQQHGDDDEQSDLASFERNPARYEGALAKVLTDIAAREPAFAGQLQTIANEAKIQIGGVHGEVVARDNAKIQGIAIGVNEGTTTGTFNFTDDASREGEQAG